jgi:hypothetical protein
MFLGISVALAFYLIRGLWRWWMRMHARREECIHTKDDYRGRRMEEIELRRHIAETSSWATVLGLLTVGGGLGWAYCVSAYVIGLGVGERGQLIANPSFAAINTACVIVVLHFVVGGKKAIVPASPVDGARVRYSEMSL